MSRFEAYPADVAPAPLGLADLPAPHQPAPHQPAPPGQFDAGPAARVAFDMNGLLSRLVELGGSDLHITAGIAPSIRLHGALMPLGDLHPLNSADTEALVRSMLSDELWHRFDRDLELDTAYSVAGVGRFRVNVYRQRGSVGAAFRAIPTKILSVGELGLPHTVETFAALQRGLVLVTGPTGSGKSTTMAGLLDAANKTRTGHIMTIEDPIEFVHAHGRCVVNQREVGSDTAGFGIALRQVLRQDPDIILVGELRDLETTSVALTAAETGHLVLATLHTQSAAQTVDRVIDIFPPHQQSQIRAQLSGCLEGVVTQALVPTRDGKGRAVVCEVMVATSAIRNLIREAKAHQIPTVMQSSSELGMITFDQHLSQLYLQGQVNKAVALDVAHNPDEFKRLARL